MLNRLQTYRNVQRAIKSGWKKGYCLNFVHTMWTIPSDGTQTAWLEAQKVQLHPLESRRNKWMHPIFFGPTSTNPDGHVVLSAGWKSWKRKNGKCFTTDYAGDGTVSKQKIADVQRWCGGNILGQSDVLDGRKLP